MEPGADCSCRITEDLPRELATIADASGSEDGCDLPRPIFPGVLLTSAGELCAAIGFDVEPGRTMAIAAPIFLCPAAEIQSNWIQQLFREVLREATRRQIRVARYLRPTSSLNDSDLMPHILSDAGFSIRAGIAQWECRMVLESGVESSRPEEVSSLPGIDCEQLPGDVLATSGVQRKRILNLLRVVLSGTQDLANLPSPDAEELLDDWTRQRATIVVGRRGGQEIAVCVCVQSPSTADRKLTVVRLQYIGVVPEHRRTGAASGLIRNVPRLFSSAGRSDVALCASDSIC